MSWTTSWGWCQQSLKLELVIMGRMILPFSLLTRLGQVPDSLEEEAWWHECMGEGVFFNLFV